MTPSPVFYRVRCLLVTSLVEFPSFFPASGASVRHRSLCFTVSGALPLRAQAVCQNSGKRRAAECVRFLSSVSYRKWIFPALVGSPPRGVPGMRHSRGWQTRGCLRGAGPRKIQGPVPPCETVPCVLQCPVPPCDTVPCVLQGPVPPCDRPGKPYPIFPVSGASVLHRPLCFTGSGASV